MKILEKLEYSEEMGYIGSLIFDMVLSAVKKDEDLQEVGKVLGKTIKKWVSSEIIWKNNAKMPNEDKVKKDFLKAISSGLN